MAAPVITGTAVEGNILGVTNGDWTNSPTSFTRQWMRCDASGANAVVVSSVTGAFYKLGADDVGKTIRCWITSHNDIGSSLPVLTVQTGVVSVLTASVPTLIPGGTPTITGTSVQGNTLGISNGSWTNSPTSFARQWKRCDPVPFTSSINTGDTIISGQTWTVTTNPDATLVEFYADGNLLGSDTTEPYTRVVTLANGAHTLGLAITIGGVRTIYTTAGLAVGTFANVTVSAGPVVVTGAGVAISGETNTTYALVAADVGKTIRCLTTAINVTGNSIPVQSEQTGVITSSSPPSPPPVQTPWLGWGNEISLVKHTSPPAPEIVYQTNGTVTLLCRDATPIMGTTEPVRQLVSVYLPGGAQATEGRRVRYEWTQTFVAGWQGTTGEINFFFEWHTQTGQGAGKLSCGIGARCNYPLSHSTPGVNPTWFFRPHGPGGTPPLSQMIGPAIVVGTPYAMKVEVRWSSTAGEFKVWLNGVQVKNFTIPTLWAGDNPSMGLYNYRYDVPHTASINFSKPVVTIL